MSGALTREEVAMVRVTGRLVVSLVLAAGLFSSMATGHSGERRQPTMRPPTPR